MNLNRAMKQSKINLINGIYYSTNRDTDRYWNEKKSLQELKFSYPWFRRFKSASKTHSKNSKHRIAIDFRTEDIKDIYIACGGRCFYCGVADEKNFGMTGERLTLDRVDNKMGYTRDNTVICCRRCNQVKSYIEAAISSMPTHLKRLNRLKFSREEKS